VERSKPHPDIFLKAAAGIEVGPLHCVAVEDSHNGVRAAHAAGMMTVMVPDIVAPDEEMHLLCVAVLDDLHALRRILVSAPA
jgi:beta-phosphoglucomutase-like phosphatase (HAD superfamily)